MKVPTLNDVLQHAGALPNSGGMIHIRADGSEVRHTYKELIEQAERMLGAYRTILHRQPGDVVPILLSHSVDFFPAFWGCVIGGMVPVPLAIPAVAKGRAASTDDVRRLIGVWKLLGQPPIVSGAGAKPHLDRLLAAAGGHGELTYAVEELRETGRATTWHDVQHSDLAFIQFSSGSTGAPKGIQITHANVTTCIQQMAARSHFSPSDIELSWMPYFHDMGLVGCHLMPLSAGAWQIKMPTFHFLKQPSAWIDLAVRHRANILSATNSALGLFLSRVKEPPSWWDLSHVRLLFNGAEPIHPMVCRAFLGKLKSCGLHQSIMYPSYGMAETTLAIALPHTDTGPRYHIAKREPLIREQRIETVTKPDSTTIGFTEIGPPVDGLDLRIVDTADRPVGPLQVGHIQVRGPNVFSQGYYHDAHASAAAFCGEWLRTGDLGFLLDGCLTVTGRAKDVLFIGGRNVYADDVENVASTLPTVGPGRTVACGLYDADAGREKTVLFVALRNEPWAEHIEDLLAISRHVHRTMGFKLDTLVPITRSDIHKTTSGKVRRHKLRERFEAGEFNATVARIDESFHALRAAEQKTIAARDIPAFVAATWAQVLDLDPSDIDSDDPFRDLGGSSIEAVEVLVRLEQAYNLSLSHEVLIECATVADMADYLRRQLGETRQAHVATQRRLPHGTPRREPIAVITYACRFPSAPTPQAYWELLRTAANVVRPVPLERGFPHPAASNTHGRYVGSFLDNVFDFDPSLFAMSVDEARYLDPQQRLLLELTWELLDLAGYGGERRQDQRVGVFVGASQIGHQEQLTTPNRAAVLARLQDHPALSEASQDQRDALLRAMAEALAPAPLHPSAMVGNLPNMLAARLAHAFNLRGPAMAIDTACSSALVALHLACESLERSECELAIVGGVNLNLTPTAFDLFAAAGALSATGCSRPFSKEADGIVLGEGGGVVLLKPLGRALYDRDPIAALIRGSSINNDGRSIGAMAPNPEGQRQVLQDAYVRANVDPASISLLEAHATGTVIGDPVEIRALSQVFSQDLLGDRKIPLGSVKARLGHLLGAAGMASLIKVLLCLRHEAIPASIEDLEPNPRLRLDQSPFVVPQTCTPWPGPAPRRAGVSAFGFGGTNAHVVLEQAPMPTESRNAEEPPQRSHHLLALSAAQRDTLSQLQDNVRSHVATHPQTQAGELCFDLATGRAPLAERGTCIVEGGVLSEAALAPANWLYGSVRSRRAPRVAFMFPGQGSAHVGQGQEVIGSWRSVRRRLEAAATLVDEHGQLKDPLLEACYGQHATPERVTRTDVAQPLLVAYQLAFARALIDLGIEPVAVIGHSVGELAAACIAGALTDEQTLRWACDRGRLMQPLSPAGTMVAVHAGAETVAPLVGPHAHEVAIAATNGPAQTVLAGAVDALDHIVGLLEAQGITTVPLAVSHGFHSPLMAPAVDAIRAKLPALNTAALTLPFASTVLGTWAEGSRLDSAYWCSHVMQPVLFDRAFATLAESDIDVFLEIGPGTTLSALAKRLLDRGDQRSVLSLLPAPQSRRRQWLGLLATLGELWRRGSPLRWSVLDEGLSRRQHTLPTYPFARQSFRLGASRAPAVDDHLLWQIKWKPEAPETRRRLPTRGRWWVLTDSIGVGDHVVAGLQARGNDVVTTAAVSGDQAAATLAQDNARPVGVVYLWSLTTPTGELASLASETLAHIKAMIAVLRTLSESRNANYNAIDLWLVTANALSTTSTEDKHSNASPSPPNPLVSPLHALLHAAAYELPHLRVHTLDLQGSQADSPAQRGNRIVETLWPTTDPNWLELEEPPQAATALPSWSPVLALRDDNVLKAELVPAKLRRRTSAEDAQALADGAVLITGGCGGVGLEIARALARTHKPPLVLTGRRPHQAHEQTLAELRAAGATVAYLQADVTHLEAIRFAIDEAESRFGSLTGVVHAAGASTPGSLLGQSHAELVAALAAKVAGTCNLAAALEGVPISWCVCFSSIASVFPALAGGLTAYAAANAFIDSFCARQRHLELPWTSINWSLWADVGMAKKSSASMAAALRTHGLEPLRTDQATAAFLTTIASEPSQVVICDHARTVASPPAVTPTSASATLQGRPDAMPRRQPHAPAHESKPQATNRASNLDGFIRTRLAKALNLEASELTDHTPFTELGLDSLAAVDIVKDLEAQTNLELSPALLFEHDTLARLLAHLAQSSSVQPSPTTVPQPAPTPPTPAEPNSQPFPLLPAQKTFYANQAFYPDLPCYVLVRADVVGPVDIQALERGAQTLSERHPMLRTIFWWQDNLLVQQETSLAPVTIRYEDLREFPASEQQRRLTQLITDLQNEIYDLERGPLFRWTVVQTETETHTLVFNVHHIVADAWSATLVVREWLALHAAATHRGEGPLPPLRATFRDAVSIVERTHQGEAGQESQAYWQQALAGAPASMTLPFDGETDPTLAGRCRSDPQQIDPETSAMLKALARRWHVSLFHLVLACYVRCLQRWSCQSDLVIRVANARREARIPDIDRLVGCFADSYPVRVQAPPELPMRELAARVRHVCTGAQNHVWTSSLELAGAMGERAAGPRGLTPAGFSFPNFPHETRVGDLELTNVFGAAGSGFTQLGLIGWEFNGALCFSWNYRDKLFLPSTIERLATDFAQLLDDVGCAPSKYVASIGAQLGSERPGGGFGVEGRDPRATLRTYSGHEERRASPELPQPVDQRDAPHRLSWRPPSDLTAQRTQTSLHRPHRPAPMPPGETLVARLLWRMEQTPERAAAHMGEAALSYAQLAERSAAVAEVLVSLGAEPGTRVGIVATPSLEALVAVVGILRAGAAYVPLDPNYPDARIRRMINHARLDIVVLSHSCIARLTAFATPEEDRAEPRGLSVVLVPDTAKPTVCRLGPSVDPAPDTWNADHRPLAPDDPAYIMYTSGSTGDPKGVVVSHRAVCLFHDWVHQAFEVCEDDRFIQTSSLAFGGSIRQMFSPLLAGATVFPAPAGLTRDPHALVRFLVTHRISIWNSVPTLLERLLDAVEVLDRDDAEADLSALRWVLTGGEELPAPLVSRWHARFGSRFGSSHRLANLYGSTETIVNATWFEITAPPAQDQARIPIGKACSHNHVVLINAAGAVCAPGEIGEIHVGGDSLATGYLFAPELTAQVFVSATQLAPGLIPDGTYYKTGDLGRIDSNGDLIYLGRSDSQVQVHGNRVELSEIEATLVQHPGVREAVVVAKRDGNLLRLTAYLGVHEQGPSETTLREHLAKNLPAYMVPHRFGFYDHLPRTNAGKLDRRALAQASKPDSALALRVRPTTVRGHKPITPARGHAQATQVPSAQPTRAPSTPTEKLLASLWSQVLGRPAPTSVEDDFFALGGDSILALEVLHRLRGHVAVVPRPATLYANRVLRQLAQAIDQAQQQVDGAASIEASPIQRPANEPFALSPAQASFVLAEKLRPGLSASWSAMVGLYSRAEAPFDQQLFSQAVRMVVARHPMLQTTLVAGTPVKQRERHNLPQWHMPLKDLADLPLEAQREELDRLLLEARTQPFDLHAWPLVRMHVLKLSPTHHLWLVTAHHAVGDAWSAQVLAGEVLEAYDALSQGCTLHWTAPRTTYRDYVALLARERSPNYAADHSEARAYWAQLFSSPWSEPSVLPPQPQERAPSGHGAGAAPAETSTETTLWFDHTVAGSLRQLARRWRVSPQVLVLTAFLRTLRQHTQTNDLVVGTALSGRDHNLPDIERVFGCFATGLPLRVDMTPADPQTVVTRVDRCFSAALAHAALPVDHILAVIPHAQGRTRPPGSQFFFTFFDMSALPGPSDQHGLQELGERLTLDWEHARFHFDTSATGTELMASVLMGEELRVGLYSTLPQATVAGVAKTLRACVYELVNERSATTPASPAPLRPVDVAIVGYLPTQAALARLVTPTGQEPPQPTQLRKLIEVAFPQRCAQMVERLDTRLGSSGLVLLPRCADTLATLAPYQLAREVAQAVRVARAQGAKSVALAGMLPSHTAYGHAVRRLLVADTGIELTTGHGATAVAVVKTYERVLAELEAATPKRLTFVGLGSIGRAAVELLLATQHHPQVLVLCDVAAQRTRLSHFAEELAARHGFAGEIRVVLADPQVPDAVYSAGFIVAATNRAGVLDVARLEPGSVVIDDSFPHAFDVPAAQTRMRDNADVLLVEAGMLDLGQVERSIHLPTLTATASEHVLARFLRDVVPGCRAEPLLQNAQSDLPSVHGLVQLSDALRYWHAAAQIDVRAAPLALQNAPTPADLLSALKARMGGQEL